MTTAGIKDRLASLGIDSAEPVIVGSGILDIVGIRPSSDIDLLVSKETFYKIANSGHEISQRPDGSEKIEINDVELMYEWYGKEVSGIAMKTTVIDGLKFMSIEEVRSWKVLFNRKKDQADILLIDKYLENHHKP
jgi:hypothetical protein